MFGNKQQVISEDPLVEAQDYAKARWFSIKGRLGRARFACYFLSVVLPIFIAIDIVQLLAKTHQPGLLDNVMRESYIPWVIIACAVIAILPLVIQRLHDFGWPAWLSIGLIIPFANLLVLVHLFIGAGQKQPNRYGAPPMPNTPAIWMLLGCLLGAPFLYFYKIFKTYLLFLLIAIY
ncbi:DUF805 domain-containing protein [Spartinivicinus poritis]|uniref:DUF805 domain-containing protein n=1 Tax=Spartinivicinus poritis TaxID=2994640 RepID=A0ABT5U9V2_9GAMM|nr:DUF805 domain-containing protein [Spartinivicinus sp. A2-2]MDE1463143.1 DUF805 domain-containing protein [Spartinivicinus sp. A2-2]